MGLQSRISPSVICVCGPGESLRRMGGCSYSQTIEHVYINVPQITILGPQSHHLVAQHICA